MTKPIKTVSSDTGYISTTKYTAKDKQIIEGWIEFANGLLGMPYKLGAKKSQSGKIDCSGLISDYGVKKYIFSTQERGYELNAWQLFKWGKEKDYNDLERGDVIFFLDLNNENVNHIATYLDGGNIMRVFDATARSGVAKRNIEVYYKDGKYYTESNGYKYKLRFATNPLVEKYKWLRETKQFKLTNYYTPTIINSGNQINCQGSCDVTADGHVLKEWEAGKVFACPKEYPLGIKVKVGNRVGICRDRGGIIVMSGQKNSRGNISTENHIDIRQGFEYQGNSNGLRSGIYTVQVIE